MKRSDTFVQYKPRHTITFMEVLKLEEMIGDREICKVRWYMLDSKGLNVQSNFPMMSMDGEFSDFVQIPRMVFNDAVKLMKQMEKEQKATDANDTISLRKLILKTRRKVINSIKVYNATA